MSPSPVTLVEKSGTPFRVVDHFKVPFLNMDFGPLLVGALQGKSEVDMTFKRWNPSKNGFWT